jgi:DNA mismatch repair protein PMS2
LFDQVLLDIFISYLLEYGSELVEVTDNGQGISTDNFEALCLKHYTSKIQEFEDLLSVETFGFRGEALSSLCALSKLSVTTCERDDPVGWKLEYDHHGKLVQQIKYSRQVITYQQIKLMNQIKDSFFSNKKYSQEQQ